MTRQPPPPCNRFLGPVSSNTDNPRRGCWARVAQATGRGLPGPLLPPASAVMTLCGAAAISSVPWTLPEFVKGPRKKRPFRPSPQ
ncbi:PREDICTED: uncharacterized protein LOC105501059 isoform X3 [Colobus angolensis palliatus]|uniref:uncharacterized protein LOC105501059 isoform X3 n=1 Tax=Colobus angolensis palliatus TaxID=336983 RepID=UPI0005F56BAA|nr:PREDICTED: uncharacterized protein LOC105501059 isoform X3 [Colobus angolensis palliatus]